MPSLFRTSATFRRRAAAFAALAACCLAVQAAAPAGQGVATILDGEATLVHETTAYTLAEGVRLVPGDIVETGAQAHLVRLEFDDGHVLNLGPATRVLLGPRFTGAPDRAAEAYLLQGWAKTDAPLAGALLDVREPTGKVVVSVQGSQAEVFAESGTAALLEHRADATAPVVLKPGEFFDRHGEARSLVSRPESGFLSQVPRPFVDTLPLRAAQFANRPVAPRPVGTPTYDALAPWIDAEPALRRGELARWEPLAHDPAFRKALVAHLAAHREWEPVLFPRPARASGNAYPNANAASGRGR